MSDFTIGLLSFPALLALIFVRVPIGLAMFLTGMVGIVLVTGDMSIPLARLKSETYTTFSNYSLSIIPMFLLMGQFASLGGISQALFRAAESLLGHRKGGMAMAAVGACAGFGAICGSSLATAATMSRVALPELKRAGYDGGLSTATLAAGGTLGILIPPSVVLVIYAILTEQNIAKLFLAAFIPGMLAALGYVLVILVYVRLHPDSAGAKPRVAWARRLRDLRDTWPVLVLFGLVVGGIYLGWFTPTEAAAVGAMGTAILAWTGGGLTARTLVESFESVGRSTAMIFFIILGAAFFNGFLALTQVPQNLALWVGASGVNPWQVLILILLLYLVLGCLMDSLSMILLTIPIFWPVIQALDFSFVSLAELQAYKVDLAISEALRTWKGLGQGVLPGFDATALADLRASVDANLARLGLAAGGAAQILSEAQIVAAIHGTTPEAVIGIRDTLAMGAEVTTDQLRALDIRGANAGAAVRLNTELVAIWFGILVLIVVEVGLITPPVGMNLFIINAMDRETPLRRTYGAVMYFVASDIVRVVLLLAFPVITLMLIPW